MQSDWREPVNIGSDHMVSINGLVDLIAGIAGKTIRKRHITGPLGVRGRNSDNTKILSLLGWEPVVPLPQGLAEVVAFERTNHSHALTALM